jgi:hypothetical protein
VAAAARVLAQQRAGERQRPLAPEHEHEPDADRQRDGNRRQGEVTDREADGAERREQRPDEEGDESQLRREDRAGRARQAVPQGRAPRQGDQRQRHDHRAGEGDQVAGLLGRLRFDVLESAVPEVGRRHRQQRPPQRWPEQQDQTDRQQGGRNRDQPGEAGVDEGGLSLFVRPRSGS